MSTANDPNPPNGERKLSVDERIEKLTERHEALTQSLELLSGLMQDNS